MGGSDGAELDAIAQFPFATCTPVLNLGPRCSNDLPRQLKKSLRALSLPSCFHTIKPRMLSLPPLKPPTLSSWFQFAQEHLSCIAHLMLLVNDPCLENDASCGRGHPLRSICMLSYQIDIHNMTLGALPPRPQGGPSQRLPSMMHLLLGPLTRRTCSSQPTQLQIGFRLRPFSLLALVLEADSG